MSTYLYVRTDAADAPREIPFSSGIAAIPALRGSISGQMDAAEFHQLVDDALLELYRSHEWAEYVVSGRRDAEQARLAAGGGLVWQRGSAPARESALLSARALAEYARANGASLSWS